MGNFVSVPFPKSLFQLSDVNMNKSIVTVGETIRVTLAKLPAENHDEDGKRFIPFGGLGCDASDLHIDIEAISRQPQISLIHIQIIIYSLVALSTEHVTWNSYASAYSKALENQILEVSSLGGDWKHSISGVTMEFSFDRPGGEFDTVFVDKPTTLRKLVLDYTNGLGSLDEGCYFCPDRLEKILRMSKVANPFDPKKTATSVRA